jgi:ribosomal protein L40E
MVYVGFRVMRVCDLCKAANPLRGEVCVGCGGMFVEGV